MSVVRYSIIGATAELANITESAGELVLRIDPVCSGFIRIDKHTRPLKNGMCAFRSSDLPEGSFTPTLTLPKGSYALPSLIYDGGFVRAVPVGDSYVRDVSIRERKLEEELKTLKARVDELTLKVYGKIL